MVLWEKALGHVESDGEGFSEFLEEHFSGKEDVLVLSGGQKYFSEFFKTSSQPEKRFWNSQSVKSIL